MLGDPTSHGLWEQTAPPPPAGGRLDGGIDADIAIVGAGYTGLSTALHLAEGGAEAAVLEAAEIGFGGSGRNVGLLNAGMWVQPDEVPARLGPEHGERTLSLLGAGPAEVARLIERYNIPCELEMQGTLHCAVGRKGLAELEQRAAQWQRRGAPVELLDAREAAARTGTGRYAGALLDRRAGTLQPLAYARGLARAASGKGVKLFTASPVRSLSREGDRWIVRTPRGEVRAHWVVAATDIYGSGHFQTTGEGQVRLPYFNFATAPLSSDLTRSILPNREGAWDTRAILSSFRMDKAGRLVFGSVGALRNGGHAVHAAWARHEIARLFPHLKGVDFEHAWYGMIGMTEDSMPRLQMFAPDFVGIYGYNGRGIAPGTVFGRILAGFVTGTLKESDLPLPLTTPPRARWRGIREAGYEFGAQIAHLPGALLP